MSRTEASRPRRSRRRALPVLEGLEERLVLSAAGSATLLPSSSPASGEFFHNDQQFNYTTPAGTHVEILVVGRGSLQGTTVDSTGALHLLYSKTNAYTRIMSNVHGGTGQADLASIQSRDLVTHGATTSLSGIGASVLHTINLPDFNLIASGTINVTSGIANLALNSVGPNTQIQLRELPSTVTAGQSTTVSTTSSTSSSASSSQFISDAFLVQSLAGINGEFFSAGNIIEQPAAGSPGPPPAPPGIVLKVNHINGNVSPVPDLLTDARIFGYNQATGQVVRFQLDLTAGNPTSQTGSIDPTLAPIQVQPPSSTNPVALTLGHDGNVLVLLVSTGSTLSVYNPTTGALIGTFSAPTGFDVTTMGSTDTVTVIGDSAPLSNLNPDANTLQMIDVARSLGAGTALPPVNSDGSSPGTYTPPPGFALVGGLTGLPGSNRVYATIAPTFNLSQATTTQLELLTVGTSTATTGPSGGLVLSHRFSTVSEQAILSNGSLIPVTLPSNPSLTGVSEGAVDSLLALNITPTSTQSQHANVSLLGPASLATRGTITLLTPDPITDLSESFRPDLSGSAAAGTGPALIDIQGNVQSIRGLTANGLVLNDTGYLNLLKTGKLTNSTILAQPIGHIETPPSHRTNVALISSTPRDFNSRGGVTLVPTLNQVGPLSLTKGLERNNIYEFRSLFIAPGSMV
jgi:hypothetical protein